MAPQCARRFTFDEVTDIAKAAAKKAARRVEESISLEIESLKDANAKLHERLLKLEAQLSISSKDSTTTANPRKESLPAVSAKKDTAITITPGKKTLPKVPPLSESSVQKEVPAKGANSKASEKTSTLNAPSIKPIPTETSSNDKRKRSASVLSKNSKETTSNVFDPPEVNMHAAYAQVKAIVDVMEKKMTGGKLSTFYRNRIYLQLFAVVCDEASPAKNAWVREKMDWVCASTGAILDQPKKGGFQQSMVSFANSVLKEKDNKRRSFGRDLDLTLFNECKAILVPKAVDPPTKKMSKVNGNESNVAKKSESGHVKHSESTITAKGNITFSKIIQCAAANVSSATVKENTYALPDPVLPSPPIVFLGEKSAHKRKADTGYTPKERPTKIYKDGPFRSSDNDNASRCSATTSSTIHEVPPIVRLQDINAGEPIKQEVAEVKVEDSDEADMEDDDEPAVLMFNDW